LPVLILSVFVRTRFASWDFVVGVKFVAHSALYDTFHYSDRWLIVYTVYRVCK